MVTGRFLGRLCKEKPGLVMEREKQPAGRHHSANGATTPWGPNPEMLDGLHLFPDPVATRTARLLFQLQSLSSQASGQGPGAGLASLVKGLPWAAVGPFLLGHIIFPVQPQAYATNIKDW